MTYVSNPGGAGGGGADSYLSEDAFAEADLITSYPLGISIMPVSAAADWQGNGTDASVTTFRTGNLGWQSIVFTWADDPSWRVWNADDSEWESWFYPARSNHSHTFLGLGNFSGYNETDSPASWPSGLNIGVVSGVQNFGPNTGEGGILTVETDGTDGVQHFTQYSNNTEYRRTYTGGSWSSWVNVAT